MIELNEEELTHNDMNIIKGGEWVISENGEMIWIEYN